MDSPVVVYTFHPPPTSKNDNNDVSPDEEQSTFQPHRHLLQLSGLPFNLAESMQQCLDALQRSGLPAFPSLNGCSATWDTVLCWPATPANSSITLGCPPLKGLDPTKSITKFCHESGRWAGKTPDDFTRAHGWTNFSQCFSQEVATIMKNLNNGSLGIAQDVAKNARKLEFVGLGLSFVALAVSILIFASFRRLRVFRNIMHLQLMSVMFVVVCIRLVLYIDLIFTDSAGNVVVDHQSGNSINTMPIICELMFFLLEYFKSVAFWWMFLEGFHLHNQLVFTVFNSLPKLYPFLLVGYGFPLLHTTIWLLAILAKKGKPERCLGSYYLEPEFWILDGPRMLQLVVNTLMLCNVIRVLWLKARDSHNIGANDDRMKKSVRAALMLIPLLGVPNIMQTIPFSPTKDNLTYFAIWTYLASFTYMYQGLFIATIYCFTNREVKSVLKSYYARYKLTHSTTMELRRGSRIPNNANTNTNGSPAGGGAGGGVGAGGEKNGNASYTHTHANGHPRYELISDVNSYTSPVTTARQSTPMNGGAFNHQHQHQYRQSNGSSTTPTKVAEAPCECSRMSGDGPAAGIRCYSTPSTADECTPLNGSTCQCYVLASNGGGEGGSNGQTANSTTK